MRHFVMFAILISAICGTATCRAQLSWTPADDLPTASDSTRAARPSSPHARAQSHVGEALAWTGVGLSTIGTMIRVMKDPGRKVQVGDQVVTVDKPDYTDANVLTIVGAGFVVAGLIVHADESKRGKESAHASIEFAPNRVAICARF